MFWGKYTNQVDLVVDGFSDCEVGGLGMLAGEKELVGISCRNWSKRRQEWCVSRSHH